MAMGLRVTEEEEYAGVDASECGLEAYPEFSHSSNYPVLSWQFGPYGALFLGGHLSLGSDSLNRGTVYLVNEVADR